MVIDWSNTAVYNTIMSVATGIALLLILQFGRKLQKRKSDKLTVGLSDLPSLDSF
ncbi:hypothetical protein [Listeria aquatica]|uniref:hypothetical protein n=1 Tax=Listeria aquatica TaxID=1494960 RepID=UPI0031F55DF9